MTPLILAYGIITAIILRPLAGHFAWWTSRHVFAPARPLKKPEGIDWVLGVAGALLWPIFLPAICVVFVLWRWIAFTGRMKFGAERQDVRARERERLAEIAARVDKELDHDVTWIEEQ